MSAAPSMTPTCANFVHYRLILDTDVERCPNCGRKLWRSSPQKCSRHAVWCCPEPGCVSERDLRMRGIESWEEDQNEEDDEDDDESQED